MADTPLNVIVIDQGSATIKAGFPLPDRPPLLVTPSAVRSADDPLSPLVHPFQRGVVTNWDALESLYHHIFYEQLGWKEGGEGGVLIAEPLFTTRPDREKMVQLLFEQFGVQGVHVADAPTLSLFAHGKLSGLAVDCGAGTIDICPVFEGAPLTHAARQMRLGGQDQSELLRELAGGAGVPLDLAQAEAAKEALCAVAESSDAFETLQSGAGSAAGGGSQFTLGDGRSVQLSAHALSRVAELPFAPPVGAGIAEEVLASMQLIGVEQRKAMLETIVLSGGMRGMTGFEPRLVRELGAAALYARPAAVQPPEYMVPCTGSQAAFMGGAILAKTVFPLNQYMTRAEYEERGPMYRRL